MKRSELIPKECSRCGNDLMTGKAILHLPFKKEYIVLCMVCAYGLGLTTLYMPNNLTEENWKKFWEEEVK